MIWSNFATIIWEVLHKKTSFRALEKWKMVFSSNKNENFLRQHCLLFQYAPLCTIWDHLNKLCHECVHKIERLAWNPRIFTHDSSFPRTLLKRIAVFQYFDIFWIFYARFKMRSKRREWPFLASCWILEFFWCFYD